MIFSDFVMWSAFGLVAPIFAVYITKQIAGASLGVIGFASGVYLILKSILQIPVARLIDKNRGEWDDFLTALAGSFILALVPILYIFMETRLHLYLVQALYAVGSALNFPGWIAIFTRHVDRGREGFEWSAYNTAISIGAGVTGMFGGLFADKFGFTVLFILMGVLNLVGTLLLFLIKSGLILKHNLPRVARLEQKEKRGEKIE